jgi:hypothetical protein
MLRTIPSPFLYELGIDSAETTQESDTSSTYTQYDAIANFAVGQLVRHEIFGLGTVKEFIDMGENSIVVVKFNTGQTKPLMVKYANLVTEDDL